MFLFLNPSQDDLDALVYDQLMSFLHGAEGKPQ